MAETINDAFSILLALSKSENPMLPTSVEILKKETGLSDASFKIAEHYLVAGGYIEYTTYGGTECSLTASGIEFLNNNTMKISSTARKIARLLYSNERSHNTASINQIQVSIGCQESDCLQAMRELIDERLARDFAPNINNHLTHIQLTPSGRQAVRNNFIQQGTVF